MKTTKLRELGLESPLFPGGPLHLSAASGAVGLGATLYVVPDDGLHLAAFPLFGQGAGELRRLLDGPDLPADEHARKAVKPDMESLARTPDLPGQGPALLALGSGSASNRHRGALYAPGHATRTVDLGPLYAALSQRIPGLNIEGSAFTGDTLWLAQRGNGGTNALIELDGRAFLEAALQGRPPGPELVRSLRAVCLGSLRAPDGRQVPLTFTDLSPLPDGRLVFSAAAEDTDNPYDDGAVLGSVVGVLGPDGRVRQSGLVDRPVKVEGVDARLEEGRIRLRLVTDSDAPGRAAELLTAEL